MIVPPETVSVFFSTLLPMFVRPAQASLCAGVSLYVAAWFLNLKPAAVTCVDDAVWFAVSIVNSKSPLVVLLTPPAAV